MGVIAAVFALGGCHAGNPEHSETRRPLRGSASGAIIDLGADDERTELITGFHAPEPVEHRQASWSDGDTSELAFSLKGSTKRYLLAVLGDPYHAIVPVTVQPKVNGKELSAVQLEGGWGGYGILLEPGVVREGDNSISLRYSKTGRPSVIEAGSTDSREISVRLDEIQVQPITERVRLVFNMHDAMLRASLAEGWAVDASDTAPGMWTRGSKAGITLYLEPATAKDYGLELTAHSQGGVTEQTVLVHLNRTTLGQLTFSPRKSTRRVVVPNALVHERNELVLQIQDPKAPSEVDPKSQDQRLLGLRVSKLELAPQ